MIECLIIEDYQDDVDLILRLLKKAGLNIKTTIVENEASLRKALSSERWDIILSDYTLPDLDGFLILEILKELKLDIPVIFVSGTIDHFKAVRLMKNGAKDYILKNELTRLPPAIERELKESEIRKKEKLAQQKISENESRLNVIFNNMKKGVVVIIFDRIKDDWCIKEINPVAEKMLKELDLISPKEISSSECNSISNYICGDLRKKGTIKTEVSNIFEKKFKGKTVSWIKYNASKLPNDDILIFLDDITDTKKHQEDMEHNLKEKELLLQEIHHRVRNTLQVIQSFVKMKSIDVKDDIFSKKLKEIRDQVRSMSLVYDRLYKSEDFVYIDLEEYVTSLAETMLEDWDKTKLVDLKIDIQPIKMDVEKVIPLGLILNELLTNTMKHAFNYNDDIKKTITISLKQQKEAEIRFSYADNGVGLSESEPDASTTHFGVEMLTLIATKQLRGRIDLESDKGFGFSVIFNPKPTLTKGRFRPGLEKME